jgi:hypothetical protein
VTVRCHVLFVFLLSEKHVECVVFMRGCVEKKTVSRVRIVQVFVVAK